MPAAPSAPRTTPGMPSTPSTPRTTPGMPTTPGSVPTMPTAPNMPAMPSTPTVPAPPRTVPGAPAVPRTTTPGTPTMPGTTSPSIPRPITPTMPTAPTAPVPNMIFQSRPAAPYQESYANYTDSRSNYDYAPFPPYGNNGLYISDMNPYRVPMGVPMMPLYGYDNCEDADKDWDYMKQMYPIIARKLLVDIEDECDKLEYDGSCMFDEYPDKVYLGRIVDKIYNKFKYMEEDEVNSESINTANPIHGTEEASLKFNQYNSDWDYRRDRYDRRDRNPRWVRDLIEVLLFNEILNRRRRYRGRKRWF